MTTPLPVSPRASRPVRRRTPATVLAAMVVAAGCSAGAAGTGASHHAGTLSAGSSNGRGAGAAPVGAGAIARHDASATGASGAPAAGGTGSGAPSGGNPWGAGTGPAQQALNAYLQSLVHHDGTAAQNSSDAGALGVAGVVIDVASIDAARGATTTVTLGPDTLAPTGSSSATVTFGGSVSLATAISGPKGSGQYTDTISGPLTVSDESGMWKVTNFTYDTQPVVIWPETASETVNGLHLTVGYVVSFGNITAALVGLGQESGNSSVQLQSTTLTAGSTVSGVGDFTGPPEPTGVLRFTRTGSKPTELTVSFSAANGQQDTFNLALS